MNFCEENEESGMYCFSNVSYFECEEEHREKVMRNYT
jgi:hypothetical protein